MFRDFRPDSGWALIYAYFGSEPGQVFTEQMPIAGWIQDDENEWRPGVVNIAHEGMAGAMRVEFVHEYLASIDSDGSPMVSMLIPPGTPAEEVREQVRLDLIENWT